MRVLLAALTGMGNAVLEALRASALVEALLVVSREETGPFPYYPCPHLTQACTEAGQDCRTDADLDTEAGLALVRSFAPDLILTATYHRIVPRTVIDSARWAVNIHPSLLPFYKGPTPTNWAVAYGERYSGVSFHLLEAQIDSGSLLMQYRSPIGQMNDGEVRRALYALAASHVDDLLVGLSQGTCEPVRMAMEGSAQPRFGSSQGIKLLQSGTFLHENLVRAATPYPGTEFLKSNGI